MLPHLLICKLRKEVKKMAEREEDLQKLEDVLTEAKSSQQQKDARIEEIRAELERIATETADKYQREVRALFPEGQRVMREVIEPWFSDLVTSGVYRDLMDWAKTNDRHVSLADTILYYWPEDAFKGVAQSRTGSKAYQSTAQFIVEHSYRSPEEAIKLHADSDEVWRAYFYLRNSKWDSKGNGVILDRDPTIGMGFGAAMNRQFRRVSTDASNIAGIFNTISPEVWIGFGQQIESGRVTENIENSLKPRPQTSDISQGMISGSDYRDGMRVVHEEYLRSRQWH